MKRLLGLATAAVVALALAAPASAATPAATSQGNMVQTAGVHRVLSQVQGVGPLSAGSWHAGCQMAGWQGGTNVWTFIVWQDFSTNGTSITRPVAPAAYEQHAWSGWVFAGPYGAPTQWWVTQYTALAAQAQYNFNQIVNGNVYSSQSGYVRITVHGNGTWDCAGA